MKNEKEFRDSVFEKAKQYEIRRKARNKKLLGTVSLCSLCIVIAASVRFASLYDMTNQESVPTEGPNTTNAPTDTEHNSPTPSETTSPFGSYDWGNNETTAAYGETTSAMTTEAVATETTETPVGTLPPTETSTTSAPTETTGKIEVPSATETEHPESPNSETSTTISAPNPPTSGNVISPTRLLLLGQIEIEAASEKALLFTSKAAFHAFWQENFAEELSPRAWAFLQTTFDASFFEKNIAVIALVPTNWTSYKLTYQNGILSDFQNIKIKDNAPSDLYTPHVYTIPSDTTEPYYTLIYEDAS